MTTPSLVQWIENDGLQILASLAVWATLMLAAAWLVARLLRRHSPAVRYCVWQTGLTGLVVLPFVQALLPGVPLGFALARRPAVAIAEPPRAMPAGDSAFSTDQRPTEMAVRVPAAGSGRTGDSPPRMVEPAARASDHAASAVDHAAAEAPGAAWVAPRWPLVLVGIWAVGVVANLLWLVLSALRAQMLLRGAERNGDSRFEQIRRALALRIAPHRRVSLLRSPRLRVPAVVGFLRPSILLPADCAGWSEQRIRVVLAHELAHVARRDIFWQLVARLAAALYWFHPLVWLATARMREERERSCDDCVLSIGVPPADYADALVDIAALLARGETLAIGGIGMASRSGLKDRVMAILDASSRRGPASARTRRVLAIGMLAFVTVLGVLRPFHPLASTAVEPPSGEQATASTTAEPAAAPAPAPRLESERPSEVRTSGNLHVRMLDPAGKPLPGVKLLVNAWSDHAPIFKQHHVSDADGEIDAELPKVLSGLRLWADVEGYVPLFASWDTKRQTDGDQIPERFTFPMQKGTVIGGIVQDEAGRPIEGAKVEVRDDDVLGTEKEDEQRPIVSTWLASGGDARVTDAHGRWTLDNVPAGDNVELALKVTHPDFVGDMSYGGLQSKQVVTLKALRAQTATFTLERGTRVTGTLTDPDGKPVADALVVWDDRPYWQHRPEQEIRPDAEGRYQLPPLPAGKMLVTVMAPGWMPEMRQVDIAPDMPAVDFQLRRGKTLRLRFVDSAGNPLPSVEVLVKRWRGKESLYNYDHPNVLPSGIPRLTSDGVYEWTWAPDDPVTYRCTPWKSDKKFADNEITLTADDAEHVQVLTAPLHVAGSAIDAHTGRTIDRFVVIPVLEFNPNLFNVNRREAVRSSDGRFALDLERTDVAWRVRIEAEGYRSAMSEAFRVGQADPEIEFRLEPAAAAAGRVVGPDGKPVTGAKVYLATKTQSCDLYSDQTRSNQVVESDAQGTFAFPAQFERYTIIATHDVGYAEVHRPADQAPGEMRLGAWARVEGRVVESGRPIGGASVLFNPLRLRVGEYCYIEDNLFQTTDETGRFVFERVPPIPATVAPRLSPWREFPIVSAESMPLDLQPGQQVTLDLGGNGPTVRGRVALKGVPAGAIDLNYSLNWLVQRAPGMSVPPEIAGDGFDWRRGWQNSWADTAEGNAYRQTLHHYFVRLAGDGALLVSGVPAGEYDLALKIYERPEGCLVDPIGTRVVSFRVTEADVAAGTVDLGTIEVDAALGPKPGEVVEDFEFTLLSGGKQKLSDFRGRYVLLDFWASWCQPCVASLPTVRQIHEAFGGGGRLVVVGLSVDADRQAARQVARGAGCDWLQGYLGDTPEAKIATRLGISSVPAYVLIDPAGKLVFKHYQADKAKEEIGALLSGGEASAEP